MTIISEPVVELATFAATHGIKYFLLQFTDLFGVGRSKMVPTSAIATMQKNGAGFAGFACYFDMTAAYPDMFGVPDPSSCVVLPWKRQVAWVACDVVMEGQLVAQAPRNVLKAQVAAAKARGLQMKSGVECEFFLLSATGIDLADPNDTAEKPCYDQGALMRKFDVIAELCDYMQELGWKPYQNDHEDGNGQYEMNWEYDECMVTADRHTFFKFMAKSVAEKHGMRATFMPKPFANRTGSGAHCHVSVWDPVSKLNLFEDDNGELGLSPMAYHFIGGVLEHAGAMCAITNPLVNSFKRIDGQTTQTGSSWAPCSVTYTGNNRTHMLRIPEAGRFEFRLADGAVNPYLLQACLLAAGLDGMSKSTDPGVRADYNGHEVPPSEGAATLPENLLDALRLLEASTTMKETLGEAFITAYVKLKKQQWRAFCSSLSQWELDTGLDC